MRFSSILFIAFVSFVFFSLQSHSFALFLLVFLLYFSPTSPLVFLSVCCTGRYFFPSTCVLFLLPLRLAGTSSESLLLILGNHGLSLSRGFFTVSRGQVKTGLHVEILPCHLSSFGKTTHCCTFHCSCLTSLSITFVYLFNNADSLMIFWSEIFLCCQNMAPYNKFTKTKKKGFSGAVWFNRTRNKKGNEKHKKTD